MSDWCVVDRTGGIYGPFNGMDEAYSIIPENASMTRFDVKPMRDAEQAEREL